MNRPKVLYAIQGTGNGHVSRARTLYPSLIKYFDVDFALVGKNSEVELPVPPVWTGRGITMEYSKSGSVSILKTLRSNSLTVFKREIEEMPVEQYDFIINDFESVSIRSAKKKRVPVFGLSHQAAVLAENAPKPTLFMPFGKWVLRWYAPFSEGLGFHFQRFDQHILPPVIREDVLLSNHRVGDKVIVYLPAFGAKKLKRVLSAMPYRFIVFHKSVKSDFSEQNLEWKPINAEKFSTELLRSKGVLCASGFELPAECLHLGISLVTIPIKGQYEQHCNAEALRQMGVHVIYKLNKTQLLLALHEALGGRRIEQGKGDVRPEVAEAIKTWWEGMRN
ncbi:glycosyltransferase family protein [Phaeocystidibacter marisrubri]|uniref:Glycosyl transferase n=1 Tax=Phaeocystidibacter marisrubri TaxID=1577780 RepID=A0A6L3ZJD7_9FLAO|nr:glycosyltransferase family protein [Phaeocystidibacter marisrubri]KAB2817763.1 glycosyl transferase [Phaeocystidibacter marisrubri]